MLAAASDKLLTCLIELSFISAFIIFCGFYTHVRQFTTPMQHTACKQYVHVFHVF